MKESFTIDVESTETGFSAYCELSDGVLATTTGKDISELLDNLKEAINLALEHTE